MEKKIIEIEVRALEDMKISGVVNNYSWSKSLKGKNGQFMEKIDKSVWEKAISEFDEKRLFVNHENFVNVAKDMKLIATDDGVVLEATLIPEARGLYEKIEKKIVNGFSFGFQAVKDSWERGQNIAMRKIEDMKLTEISLLSVTPAYNNTFVEARQVEVPFQHDLDLRQRQLELYKLR